jgi:hypothetical protein
MQHNRDAAAGRPLGQIGAADENDVVGEEGIAELSEGGFVQRPGQIDAGDLRAGCRRKTANRNAQGGLPALLGVSLI